MNLYMRKIKLSEDIKCSDSLCSPGMVGRVIRGVDKKRNKHLQMRESSDDI